MPEAVGIVDTTVRDGHQSLWSANALTTPMIAGAAPLLDRAGFHAVDFTSSTHMAMAVRWHREDPWERLRVVSELMPQTRLGFITPGMRFMAWQRPIHQGSGLGAVWKFLVFLSGLVPLLFVVTGVIMWAKKRRRRMPMTMLTEDVTAGEMA